MAVHRNDWHLVMSLLDTSCRIKFPKQNTNDKKYTIAGKRSESCLTNITISFIKNIIFYASVYTGSLGKKSRTWDIFMGYIAHLWFRKY